MNQQVDFIQSIDKELAQSKFAAIFQVLYTSYMQAVHQSGTPLKRGSELIYQLAELVAQQMRAPHSFEIFHQRIRHPFDYYQFGLDFIRPLIDFANSKLLGLEQVAQMEKQLSKGENVILLANHQIEPDPQIINLMLEPFYPQLAADMIFVAGHRVITDPMAIPMSMGCNLLCIYSKKYIDHPPEEKAKKVLHNQRTMQKMADLLSEGGHCIYVAPSGGRDRPNAQGLIDVAPFDPQSIEMFWLMAERAAKPTHFYPLTLHTYDIMPPPHQVEKELGERRLTHFAPVYLSFGSQIDMEHFPGSEHLDKKSKRQKRASYIWNLVHQEYQRWMTQSS